MENQSQVTNSSKKLATMVHIVGGAFITNPSDDTLSGPDFLVEHDVILVIFNYRLEAFGFMSLSTPEYSGNMGMKDQLMAIQWVHNNIEHFGGDSSQITLMGHSAGDFVFSSFFVENTKLNAKEKKSFIFHSIGSFSASFQVLNEESRKNYQRVILLSGSAFTYASYHDGDHKCLMHEIARNASRPANNIEELIEFLKTTPASQIHNFLKDVYYKLPWPLPWAPIIES